MEALRAGIKQLGLELTPDQELQFQRYRDGLIEWNDRMNLTSRVALANVERVHFLDSLSVAPVILREAPRAARLIDVGSGPGFPGVPIKLLFPTIQLTLVEATTKKVEFLRWLVLTLGLDKTTVVGQRAEWLAHEPNYRESFDIVTARALGSLRTVLELTLPFCGLGGIVITPRAGDVMGEAEKSMDVAETLGGRLRSPFWLKIEGLREDAVLFVADKISNTDPRYPRRNGVPARKPLGR